MSANKPPAAKGAEPSKKSSGGFWGKVGKALSNISFEVNVGAPASARRGPAGDPTDPAARMEPVRQDRKETYDEMVYRTTDGTAGQAPAVRVDRERQHVARSLDTRANGGGAAAIPQAGGTLPKDVRNRMEPRLGADLSNVRVGTGGESQQAAAALGAKAFTVGSDVHFGSGQFTPGSKEGDKLLAHELTHVVQGQRSGVQRKAEGDAKASGQEPGGEHKVSEPGEPAEVEADSVAEKVTDDLHGKRGDQAAGTGKGGEPNAHGAEAKDDKAAGTGHGAVEAKADKTTASAGGATGPAHAPAAAAHEDKADTKQAAPAVGAKLAGAPVAIRAKLDGDAIGRKIYRVTGGPPGATPKPAAGGSVAHPAGAPGAAPAANAAAPDPNQVAFQRQSAVAGGSDKVEVRPSNPSGDGAAELMVANQRGNARFLRILAGPMGGADNKAGYSAVTKVSNSVKAAADLVAAMAIKAGKVDTHKQAAVAAQFQTVASEVSGLVSTLKVTALEQAEHLTPMKNKKTATFKKPDPSKWKKPYVARFVGEMVRQLQMQQNGMNALSLDKWVVNFEQYAPDQKLNEIHDSARQVVLAEFKTRVDAALPRAQKRLAELQKQKVTLDAEKAKLDAVSAKPEDVERVLKELVSADKNLKKVLGNLGNLATAKPEIARGQGGATDLDHKKLRAAGGRDGNETGWAANHKLAKEELVRRVLKMDGTIKEWEGIVASTGDLAVLHNPDQICGGEGDIKDFPVVDAPGPEETADNRRAWEEYLAKVKSHFGVLDINSSIGSQWKGQFNILKSAVTGDPDNPQEAYGIRKLDVELKPV